MSVAEHINQISRDRLGTVNPYLPDGRRWLWRTTQLLYAKDCARKYYYSEVLGWKSKGGKVHLVFGGLYAAALEDYHKLRAADCSHEIALRRVIAIALCNSWPWPFDHKSKTRENLIRSIIWYFEEFRDDPCKTVILANTLPAVELEFKLQITDDIVLTSKIDRLIEYGGGIYVQDQKTTGSTISPYYFDGYNPDNQMTIYTIAGNVIYNTPVKGVIIDAAQIAVGFTRFARGFTHRTKSQMDEWLRDAEYHIKMNWAAGEAGWPMNDASCNKFGGCQFRDICSKSPEVRDQFLASNFVREASSESIGTHQPIDSQALTVG